MVISEAQPSATRGNETVTFRCTVKSLPSSYRGWRFHVFKSKVKKKGKFSRKTSNTLGGGGI